MLAANSFHIAALLISTVCYLGAIVMMYHLTYRVFANNYSYPNNPFTTEYIAYMSTLLFILSPSNIFMTAGYTESLYTLLCFTGMYFIEDGSSFDNGRKETNNDISIFRSKLCSFTLATVCFTLASGVRSNGFLLMGYIVYGYTVFVLQLCYRNTIFVTVTSLFRTQVRLILLTMVTIVSCVIIMLPYISFQLWSGSNRYCYRSKDMNNNTSSLFLESIEPSRPPNDSSTPTPLPAWCNTTNSIPPMYNTIQELYWNVGLWRYWELKHIGMFILPFPIFIIVISSMVYKINELVQLMNFNDELPNLIIFLYKIVRYGSTLSQPDHPNLSLPVILIPKKEDSIPNVEKSSIRYRRSSSSSFLVNAKQSSQKASIQQQQRQQITQSPLINPKPVSMDQSTLVIPDIPKYIDNIRTVPYILHSFILMVVAILVMNVQVATRFLVACPSIYWYVTIIIFLPFRSTVTINKNFLVNTHQSLPSVSIDTVPSPITSIWCGISRNVWGKFLQGLYITYCIIYLFIGTALFVNFYNWT